jgi:rubrerythrin
MAPKDGWTSLEVLGMAIRSEIEAASVYASMATRVQNPSLVAKLDFLRHEEEKHRTMLENLYLSQFPDVELQLPSKSFVPVPDKAELDGLSVPELFELAMQAEQASADFYSQQADQSTDQRGRTVLRYLSNVEHSHYQMLETEYELLSQFPDYYNADDFHTGTELVHIGP